MTDILAPQKIGLVGGVVRGPPPEECAATCKAYLSATCATCESRPIKDVEIGFGDMVIEEAIRIGLVTPAEVEAFRRAITGGK